MDIHAAKSGTPNAIGVEMTLKTVGKKNKEMLVSNIQAIECVSFAIQRD
jgi:hypothetical protein